MSMREVFRVVYAPHKAFKEIIQKPGYKGPLIIMLLFVLSLSGFYYVFSTRVYYDQTVPGSGDLDKWTENASLWSSKQGATISNNTSDYIKGNFYGNKSVQFELNNSNRIDMQLNFSEPLNCVEPNNYTNLSFRIKIIKPSENPSNLSIFLCSENDADKYFNYSMEGDDLEIVNVWYNGTISLANFIRVNGADWRNITSLKFELAWENNKDITVLVDGIFFHGYYKSILEMSGGAVMINSVISGFMQFTVQWVILAIILYLFSKLFKAQPVWKTMLTISGFVLITFFIQNLILTGVVLAYPEMHLSLETLGGVPGEGMTADAQNYVFIFVVLQYYILERIVYFVWIVVLCSIAVRLLFGFPWARSVSLSLLSSVISMLAFRFLMYGGVWL
ncbi:MAG: hypothetical protein QXK47_01150 [Candidatus Bathyarchaeia archaeon]